MHKRVTAKPVEPNAASAVAFDPLGRHDRSGRGLTRRIPDPGGEIADEQDHLVPGLLHLAHCPEVDRVADMEERGRHVDAVLDPERPARGQLGAQFVGRDDIGCGALEGRELAEGLIHGRVHP